MTGWYSGATRSERTRDAIERHGLDALLAVTPENAGYLARRSNFIATHWRIPGIYSAVVGGDDRLAVVSGDFGVDPAFPPPFEHLAYRSWTESVDVRGQASGSLAERVAAARPSGSVPRPPQFDLDEVFDRVANAVRAICATPRRVGVDLEGVDRASVDRLSGRLPGCELVDASGILDDLRALKDHDELDHLRLAAELTEIGIGRAIDRLRDGMSEVAVNAAYQVAVHERVMADDRFAAFRQAEGLASVGVGEDVPHVVGPGRTVKFDMQVDIAGYHSDIGRTVVAEPTADQRVVYDALLAALRELQSRVRPGVTFAQLHRTGTEAMREAGFTGYSRGHLGHSVGLTQRFEEPPFVAPGEDRPLVAGMALSIELPYYVYGVGAFQLERMLVVTDDGLEALDRLPFELEIGLRG